MLLVRDDCGLSDTMRLLCCKPELVPDEYAGRALGYQLLEKWARMGIGVTLLPGSQISDPTHARPVVLSDGSAALITFDAPWAPRQEARPSFGSMTACLSQADPNH